MPGLAPQSHEITTEEERTVGVNFTRMLGDSETLTGSPVVLSDDSITITDEQINSAVTSINDESVSAYKAVLFKVQGATVGDYFVEIKCNTSTGQVIEGWIEIGIVATKY